MRFQSILVGAVVTAACSVSHPPASLSAVPAFEAGFSFFPSPRTSDSVGTVFRIDPAGVRHNIVNLSSMVHVTSSEESIPKTTSWGNFQAGLVLGSFGVNTSRIQLASSDSVVVQILGAHRDIAFEVDLRRLTDSAAKLIDWSLPGRVFVIVETISADSLNIFFSQSSRRQLGDSLLSGRARGSGVSVSWAPGNTTQLIAGFRPPRHVLFKTEQLTKRAGALEPDSLGKILRIKIAVPVTWTAELPQ